MYMTKKAELHLTFQPKNVTLDTIDTTCRMLWCFTVTSIQSDSQFWQFAVTDQQPRPSAVVMFTFPVSASTAAVPLVGLKTDQTSSRMSQNDAPVLYKVIHVSPRKAHHSHCPGE